MGRVAPYHTTSTAYMPSQREVYHDHDDCRLGREIKSEDREPGEGYRPICKECIKLGS